MIWLLVGEEVFAISLAVRIEIEELTASAEIYKDIQLATATFEA